MLEPLLKFVEFEMIIIDFVFRSSLIFELQPTDIDFRSSSQTGPPKTTNLKAAIKKIKKYLDMFPDIAMAAEQMCILRVHMFDVNKRYEVLKVSN